ncbi:MAG: T9SS type A sorting domain-containing protein [Bacteroidia bacterium]|nr:T9SS type A sorting domain-containing protein [Bacteroidia bacterium]MCZ2278531.1 T9SS type A sorting domain-containing protein [Bacteroidia bacterium]
MTRKIKNKNMLGLRTTIYKVGDYDGDGKDELLGNDNNGWTTLFKFTNGNWQWVWSDNGNASDPIRPYKDKFYAGDFNSDGKDELFGCDLPNGWITTFKWNDSNFIWDWSDYGSNHAIRQYRTNMLPGDFDGDDKVEVLGFDGWLTLFHFDNGNWQCGWSTTGANNFNGWTYPPLTTDRILAGNLESDNKNELFFLPTHSTAAWATTIDLRNDQNGWNWNWSANPQYCVPSIDDWPLAANGGSNTKYYLVKAKLNEPKYLLVMRKSCSNYLINMYKSSSPNNKMTKQNIIADNFNSSEYDNDISAFPNPTNREIQILSAKSDLTYIDVLDPRGQSIYNAKYSSQQKVEMDLSKYPTGIYILKVSNAQNLVSIHKIILNK